MSTTTTEESLRLLLRRVSLRGSGLGASRLAAVHSTAAALLLSQVLLAVAGVVAARALGPDGKGVITAVTTWAQLLLFLSLTGLAWATNVRVASDSRSTPVALGNSLVYALGVGGVATLGGLLFVPVVLDRLGSDAQVATVLALTTIPVGILTECMLGILLGQGRNRAYQTVRVAGPIFVLIATLALWAFGELTILTGVAAIALGSFASGVVAAIAIQWKGLAADLRTLRQDFSFGLRVFVGGLIGLVNSRFDLVLMSVLLPAAQIGYYGVANNVVSPILILAASASVLLTSAVARSRNQGEQEGFTRDQLDLISETALRYTLLTFAAGILLVPVVPFLIPFLFGASFDPTVELVWILIPGFVASGYAAIAGAGAVGIRRPWLMNASEGSGLVLTVALLPFLLPRYEAVGAAITSSVAYTVSAVVAAVGLRYLARQALISEPGSPGDRSESARPLAGQWKGVTPT